jgi:hypothetical protein
VQPNGCLCQPALPVGEPVAVVGRQNRVTFGAQAKVLFVHSLKPHNYDHAIWGEPREYHAQTRLNMVEARLDRFHRALEKTPNAVVYTPTPVPQIS